MFDEDSISLIRSAPPLSGLDLDEIPRDMTRAYSAIVALRIRLRDSVTQEALHTELPGILERLERIALTQEAFVVARPTRSNREAAAFVAASAHQVRYAANRLILKTEGPSELSADAIAPEIAATLLFLIAGRSADAAQMARGIRVGTASTVEGVLLRSLIDLATGKLEDLLGRSDLTKIKASNALDSSAAVTLLWTTLLTGLRQIATPLLGVKSHPGTDSLALFALVKALSVEPVNVDNLPGQVISVLPGPHHLASLLHSTAGVLLESALVNVEPPSGVSAEDWRSFTSRIARGGRPLLWPNHRKAVALGYLKPATSAVVSFPTGAGKSTLTELKIGVTRLLGKKVVFLAPTHALVDQVASDLRRTFPDAQTTLEDEVDPGEIGNVAVMTPERCLALLGFAPELFNDVGLLVFDECHLMHPRDGGGRRSIDAMLCLLSFVEIAPAADILLVSAMVKNSQQLSEWLSGLTGRECLDLSLSWKPTRQARGCVVYPQSLTKALQKILADNARLSTKRTIPTAIKRKLAAPPMGMFSLWQTWRSREAEDYTLLRLLDEAVPLNAAKSNGSAYLTANRNGVAAALASRSGDLGIKTLVFAQTIPFCCSLEHQTGMALAAREVKLTPKEESLWQAAVAEAGGEDYTYCRRNPLAALHHGLLLPVERQLNESLFRRDDGIHVLVATSTLAQGMNLPSQLVIIAGDDRFDIATNQVTRLEAHELLNAAGRAGRAGEAAEGLVVLVPSKVISYDETKHTITGHWFALQEIFSKSDQCLEIDDPLQPVLDRIHAATQPLDDDAEYFLRRLPLSIATGDEPTRRLLNHSFAAFKAHARGDTQWIQDRVQAAVNRRTAVIKTEAVISWEDELAASTGLLTGDQIRSLGQHLEGSVGEPVGNIEDWIKWALRWLEEDPLRLGAVARPSAIIGTFGKGSEGFGSDVEKATTVIGYLRNLLPLWITGKPLVEIQSAISPNKVGKCDAAREFALRVAPELAYFFGLIPQVFKRIRDLDLLPLPIATLGRCLREGFDSPDKLALRIAMGSPTRVVVHQTFTQIEQYLKAGSTYESVSDAVRRMIRGLRKAGIR